MSMMKRRRAPETARAEILNRAMEVAAERGAAGFTLDAVVEGTGLSKGALLHHFPNKTALLEALMDHLGGLFVQAVEAEARRDPQPYGRSARAYLRVTIKDALTDGDVSLGRAALAACAIDPAVARRWKAALKPITSDDPTDPAGADDALMLRLLADGLWLSDLFGMHDVSAEQRQALLHLLTPGNAILEAAE